MTSQGNKEVFSRNLRYYMNMHDKTRNEICDALGLPYTTFTAWETAQTYPRIDKIEKLAAYFGISKSDLIEERADRADDLRDDTATMKVALFGGDVEVTDAMWEEAKAYAQVIAARERGRGGEK